MSTPFPLPVRIDTLGYTLERRRHLNVSNRCNLRCSYCPRARGEWCVAGHDLRLRRDPSSLELMHAACCPGQYEEIVFCGLAEPTLRLGTLLSTAARLRHTGARLVLHTDGLANLVHGRDVTGELGQVFDAVSVSLDAADAEGYERLQRPTLPRAYRAVLDFVRRLRDRVPRVELTAIEGLPGVWLEACSDLARRLDVGLRTRRIEEVGA